MGKVYNAVVQAQNSQQAMIAIATALDEMFEKLDLIVEKGDGAAWDAWEANSDYGVGEEARPVAMAVNHNDDEVVFHEPDADTRAERREFAQRVLHLDQIGDKLEPDEWLAAYEVGGPMWLWVYDRGLVMQQTRQVRTMMVQDVEKNGDPQSAQDLAVDILKFTQGESPKAVPQ